LAKKEKERFAKTVNIKNRKASHEFEFIDRYTAGMVLQGTEIKSIREGKVNLQDSYCVFFGSELFVRGLHISPYTQATHYNHDETRERKLLLSRKELRKLQEKVEEKGLTIAVTRLFISDRGYAKLDIALARGKKLHDKRDNIKEKDIKREMERVNY